MDDLKAELFHFPSVHTREFCELAIKICFGFALAIVCYASLRSAQGEPLFQAVLWLCILCDFGVASFALVTLGVLSVNACRCGLSMEPVISKPDKLLTVLVRTVVLILLLITFYLLLVQFGMRESYEKIVFIGLGFFLAGLPFVLFLCSGKALEFQESVRARCSVVDRGEEGGKYLQDLLCFCAVVFLLHFAVRILLGFMLLPFRN